MPRRLPFRPKSDNPISQTYNDGFVILYTVKDTAEVGKMPAPKEIFFARLDYENRSVGVNQYYTAAQAAIRIERIVRVQARPGIDTKMIAEDETGKKYTVARVQLKTDTHPQSVDLTLTEYKTKGARTV